MADKHVVSFPALIYERYMVSTFYVPGIMLRCLRQVSNTQRAHHLGG